MNTNDKLELKEVQILAEQNTRAIEKLTETVSKLSDVVAKEDSRIIEMIAELKEANAICKQNQKMAMDRLEIKSKRLEIIELDIRSKLPRHDFEKLVNRLWSIGGTILSIILAMLGYLIKLQLEHNG